MKSFMTVIIFIIILVVITYPWNIMFLLMALSPDPPKPEVKSAEFSFRLEYKIDGETHVIEDTYVAKYNGIDMNEGRGKFRKWKGHIKGSWDKNVFLSKINGDKIYYTINFPEYYMGDDSKPEFRDFGSFYSVYKIGPSTKHTIVELDELLEDYGIELISWEMDDPIVNTFK